jgi:hypothetical protein
MDAELQRAIGRLEGKLDAVAGSQTSIMSRLDKMDERLRAVEIKAALFGAGGGGLVAAAVTVLAEIVKSKAGIP